MVVVDDDSKVRLLLERALRPPEFETHVFATGAAALERLGDIRPDCVVSDILMPDMDGERLVRAIRAVPGLERVPFIAVSAVRSEARIRAALAAGADAFLQKPFPLRDLLDKVRTLRETSARRPEPRRGSDDTSPTRPVVTAPHTTSTAAVRRRPRPPSLPPAAVPPVPPPTAASAPPGVTSVRVPTVRVVVPTAPPADDARRVELRPADAGLGFGRFTRVQARGRSFVVLTEAAAQPKFTVTTVITEKGVPLRRIESALPHPLAREDDGDTVRRQLDLQHDDALRRLTDLVLDLTPRRVVWSDQSRSVDAGVLAWAMSAVAQLAETEAGTDETVRQLRRTHERALAEEGALRAFRVTPAGRVVADPDAGGRVPRRAVRAVAGWCRAFAAVTMQSDEDRILGPVRQATRPRGPELERMGFYERLRRPSKA
jgi:two-component system phosphate regulon response regulator PhoB